MEYLTEKEIHVLGLQRTGQHGVISWIIGHFNNPLFKNGMTSDNDKGNRCLMDGDWWDFNLTDRPDFTWKTQSKANIGHDAIILGTEYLWNKLPLNSRLEVERDRVAKELNCESFSRDKRYVMVLRSPYNQLASWMKWKGTFGFAKRFASCWKVFAKEFVGETDTLPCPKIFLNYDKWFSDESYRRIISGQLGVPFSDKGLNIVMRIGRGKVYGSSFDKMNHKQTAQSMNVTERWRDYQGDDFFLNVMSDPELRRLSEQIFGEFPF